jgi:hypothetical protein
LSKEKNNKKYLEGKLEGMFSTYEAFDVVISKLRSSIDNVWMIHDQEDLVKKSSEEQKDRLMFAQNALWVLREMFDDEYDSRLNEVKALRDYEDEI